MLFKKFFNDLNLDSNDNKYLILLLLFGIALAVIMIKFNQTRGAFNSDIYVYLPAALDFAGLNFNHISDPSWLYSSPVIEYLTSLLFRLGFVDITSIFIVTGVFGILGMLGMYVFLKIRFSSLLSFTGAILYSSLSLTLYYFANGMLDTSAVAMIIWTLIFTVAAVNKNPKYYVLVAIFYSISFFTRFATGYMIILIILYMITKHDIINLIESLIYDRSVFKNRILTYIKSTEFKWIIISVCIASIIFAYVFYVLLSYYPELGYFRMAQGSIHGYANQLDPNFIPDKLFFIKIFLNLLSSSAIKFDVLTEKFINPTPFAYLIISILFGGIILKIWDIIKSFGSYKKNINQIDFRTKNSTKILIIIMIAIGVIGIIGFKFNYLITLMALWMCLVILLSIVRILPINHDHFSISVLCFALFSFYLVIVSFINLKCVRYLLPAFPGFIYFVIYSLDTIMESIRKYISKKDKSKEINQNNNFKNKLVNIIPIILIIICLFSAFNFTNTVEVAEEGVGIVSICDFIINHDSDYQNKDIICACDLRAFEWYLNKDLVQLGIDVDSINGTEYDYIITHGGIWDDDNYEKIFSAGDYYLMKKV